MPLSPRRTMHVSHFIGTLRSSGHELMHLLGFDRPMAPQSPEQEQSRKLVAALGRHDIVDIYNYVDEYFDLPEELKPYWPVVAHWRDYRDHMSEGRRQRYLETELLPEFRSFLHVSRMPWCTEIQQMLMHGSSFAPLDYVHIVRCDHCKWLVPRWYRHRNGMKPTMSHFA